MRNSRRKRKSSKSRSRNTSAHLSALAHATGDERLSAGGASLKPALSPNVSRDPRSLAVGQRAEASAMIYNGTPSAEDLETINRLIGETTTAEEWSIWCYRASDNFVRHNEAVWHPNLLDQMAAKFVGQNFMIDHLWDDSQAIMGFVIEAQRFSDPNPGEEIINASVFGDVNRQILRDYGSYEWLMLKVVVPAGSAFDEAAKTRRTQFCSTGFFLYNESILCPDCTMNHGRPVEFLERKPAKTKAGISTDADWDLTCPHVPPSPWLRSMVKEHGDPSNQPNWASYSIYNGDLKVVELSGCASPSLAAAGIIREFPKLKAHMDEAVAREAASQEA